MHYKKINIVGILATSCLVTLFALDTMCVESQEVTVIKYNNFYHTLKISFNKHIF